MIKVVGDRVLVALPPKQEEQDSATGYTYQPAGASPSGIVLAKPPDTFNVEIATRGIVVQVGEKKGMVDLGDVRERLRAEELRDGGTTWPLVFAALDALAPAPFDVEVGDCVLFPPTAGDTVVVAGIEYVILHESEIIGIVEPLQSEAAA